jgi:hypothetical protein
MTAPPREGLFYKGKWLWMWPNWTLSLFDGGMNTSRINPLSEGRTELIYHFYFADTSDAKRPREDTMRAKTPSPATSPWSRKTSTSALRRTKTTPRAVYTRPAQPQA